MALWERIINDASLCQIVSQHSDSVYNKNGIPIEVREVFAPIIEDNILRMCFGPLTLHNLDDPENRRNVTFFLDQLVIEMKNWIGNNTNDFNCRYNQKIQEALLIVQDLATRDPIGLLFRLKEVIEFELNQFPNPNEVFVSIMQISHRNDIMSFLKFLVPKLRTIRIKICEFKVHKYETILQELSSQFNEFISNLTRIQSRFIYILTTWKLQEKHGAIGLKPKNDIIIDLNELQPIAEYLFNLTLKFIQELQVIQSSAMEMHFDFWPYAQSGINLMNQLIRNTFIVIEQPVWVVKTKEFRFNMTLCQLIGKSLFKEPQPETEVRLSMINEQQAKGLNTGKTEIIGQLEKETRGHFDAHSQRKRFEFDEASQKILVKYSPCFIKSVQRSQKRGGGVNSFVMEEKFCFLFTTTLHLCGQKYQTWTTSLPVTVSSHKTQNVVGLGVVIWDYATGHINRSGFEVAKFLPWSYVEKILAAIFRKILELKSNEPGLDDGHLKCLKRKAFLNLKRDESEWLLQSQQMSLGELTRRKFGVENNPTDKNSLKSFSFWDWFYLTIKFLKEKQQKHKEMWISRLIVGFIDKKDAERLIVNGPEGTFLLRFPDSITGAISISYVHREDEQNSVIHLEPYTLKRLEIKSLVDSIRDLCRVKYVYSPDPSLSMHKDQVFKDLYTKEAKPARDYFPRCIASATSESDRPIEEPQSPNLPVPVQENIQISVSNSNGLTPPISLHTSREASPNSMSIDPQENSLFPSPLPSISTIFPASHLYYHYNPQHGYKNGNEQSFYDHELENVGQMY